MVLTKSNYNSFKNKIIHHTMDKYDINIYYWVLPDQEMSPETKTDNFNPGPYTFVVMKVLQLELSPQKGVKGMTGKVFVEKGLPPRPSNTEVAFGVDDDLELVKNIPSSIERWTIKGLFKPPAAWGDEDEDED